MNTQRLSKLWRILPGLALCGSALAHSGQDGAARSLVRAYFHDIQAARAIAHGKYETLESKYELGYMVVLVNPQEAQELRAAGFQLKPDPQWLARQVQHAKQQAKQHARQQDKQAAAAPEFSGIQYYNCYPTVEEVFAKGDALIAAKPHLAAWQIIGSSWERTQNAQAGYDLKVLKLSNRHIPGPKPILLVQAGIHAREYSTTPLALEFASRLLQGHEVDADLTWILDHHEIHILLVANPDGRKQAERGLLWRKNTNTAYCGANSPWRGVDLNRNFSFAWNDSNGAGSSADPCRETYRGPQAASEPEVQAIQQYIRSLWPDRRGPQRSDAAAADVSGLHLDLHSHGRLLLYPWGTKGAPAGNQAQFATLARKLAYWNKYTPQRALGLYETDGTSDGPSYGELGVAALTFELGTAFFESCNDYQRSILPDNLPALIYAAKASRAPYLLAQGPDAHSLYAQRSAGRYVNISAALDGTRYQHSNGREAIRNVAAAELYIGLPPWSAGAQAIPMQASDGAFNSPQEQAAALLDVSAMRAGKHLLYVRGRDSQGNWGPLSATWLYIGQSQVTPPNAAFDVRARGLQVDFKNRSTDDGAIQRYEWQFGDGARSFRTNPAYTYAHAGAYTVQLTVTDNEGATASLSRQIEVQDEIPNVSNGQTANSIGVPAKSWRYFQVELPAGAKNLNVQVSGGVGDIDLYTRHGGKPSAGAFACRHDGPGNTASCLHPAPAAGKWVIGLFGYGVAYNASVRVGWE
ncbi:M14 family zinc carboxypeptidase [Massilia sp. W12]|uniref:M14 family zinc carboxypeptidase n=1 Tax=Massilia sp. W12 TaxID=3126507 RepID=UPI0030D309E1